MLSTRPSGAPNIGIHIIDPAERPKSEQLAQALHLSLTGTSDDYDFVLCYAEGRLGILAPGDPVLSRPVYAEFVRGAAGYRRRKGKKEMLLQAIGFRRDTQLSVVDATGGLGRDSFLMAAAGCRVHIVERNRIIAALLLDALHRAAEQPETREIADRIRVSVADSIRFLREAGPGNAASDVVYLDPMYPERSKSALVKKEMQLLQKLLGREDDSALLLHAALAAARQRVVVKRPKSAPPLAGTPAHTIAGKSTRFDVYMIHQPGKYDSR